MIKEAIQYVVGLGNLKREFIEGQEYSSQKLFLIPEALPESINVKTLSSLVDYIKSNFDSTGNVMIHIISPTEVFVFSSYNGNMSRKHFIKASAMLPKFNFDNFYRSEEFNIKLQSAFVKNEDRDIMLQVVGNIQEEAVQSVGDDGISQSVVAKVGIASVGNVKVPNPVLLAPFRTFVEIEQPESEFIFRMQKGPTCALFEADGGAWKNIAMNRIKAYFEQELAEELNNKQVVIIA